MHRDHRSWYSPSLGRDMELLLFGHGGTPLLVFPSSMGRFYEWEDFGMVSALAHQIESGQNRLICIDSVDAESFYNRHTDPFVRIMRYRQYERYVIDEVMPFIRGTLGAPFVIAAGASFGAFHAANMVFKHPQLFGKLIALSGAYDIKSFMDGFYDENVYFNNPIDYMSGIEDHALLEGIRRNHLVLTMGEHDPCAEANYEMAHILGSKGIPHTLDVVRGAFGHDWPWWRELIQKHIA